MDRQSVRAWAAKVLKRQLEAEGLDIKEEVKAYQDDQREQFTGYRNRPAELDEPAEREAIKKALREARTKRARHGTRKKPRNRIR